MFVAWRDLWFAKGRLALIGTVVGLITLMVLLLSGLTAGLGRDSTSAITGLRVEHLVFSAPADGQKVSFTESSIGQDTLRRWRQVPGVRSADPLGVATATAQADGRSAALSAFGVQPGSQLAPDASQIAAGKAVLSGGAADALDAHREETVIVAGQKLIVTAIAGDASYSHTPVIWTSLGDWQRLAPGSSMATVITLNTTGKANLAGADKRLDTSTLSRSAAALSRSSSTRARSSSRPS